MEEADVDKFVLRANRRRYSTRKFFTSSGLMNRPTDVPSSRLEKGRASGGVTLTRIRGADPPDNRDQRVSRLDLERLHSTIGEIAALTEHVRQPRVPRGSRPTRPGVYRDDLRMYITGR